MGRIIWIVSIACAMLLLGSVVPFVQVFMTELTQGVSTEPWSALGDYLSGVSSVFNVVIFIVITLMIHQADVRRHKKETRVINERELFCRFLDSYEKTMAELYSLNLSLAKTVYAKQKLSVDDFKEIYVALQSLSQMSIIYAHKSENKIAKLLDGLVADYIKPLMNEITDQNDEQRITCLVMDLAGKTTETLDSIAKEANKYIKENLR